MFINSLTVGPMEVNCYLVGDELSREVFIIDPGGDYQKIKKIIEKGRLKPKAIINTHGHGDHIGANGDFGLPVWVHRLDAEFLQDPSKNLSGAFGLFLTTKPASRLLEEGDILDIGRYNLEVIHTPGHTPGSICLKTDKLIFTGDTLFCNGIGRTDFEYGSMKELISSIKEKLLTLDNSYIIYPGHGPSSSIGKERDRVAGYF